MICNLCKEGKEKLCKSHLIPEAFYRFMYPSGKVEGEPLSIVNQKSVYTKSSRIGLYDSTILCAECDSFIGKLDDFGVKILLQTPLIKEDQINHVDIMSFGNIDTYKLRVFFLSVLWRCSISSREELTGVRLGEKYEEKIRQIILQEESDIGDFPVIITQYKYTNYNYSKVLYLPTRIEMNNVNYYWLSLPNGFKILVKFDSSAHEKILESMIVNDDKAFVYSFESFEETNEYFVTRDKIQAITTKSPWHRS